MKTILNHTHSFVKAKKFFNEMHYKCSHPDCHYLTSITNLLGKRSICSVCHINEIILDSKQLRLTRPRCMECSKSPKDQAAVASKQRVQSVLDHIFKPQEEPYGREEE